MKPKVVIVPRGIIKKTFRHPEVWGDYVVTLNNGMYTDVHYNEEGNYFTVTNNCQLINYLEKQVVKEDNFFYRNGIFAYEKRNSLANNHLSKITLKRKIKSKNTSYSFLNNKYQVLYKWAPVGLISISIGNESIEIKLDIYKNDLLRSPIDQNLALNLFTDYIETLLNS